MSRLSNLVGNSPVIASCIALSQVGSVGLVALAAITQLHVFLPRFQGFIPSFTQLTLFRFTAVRPHSGNPKSILRINREELGKQDVTFQGIFEKGIWLAIARSDRLKLF